MLPSGLAIDDRPDVIVERIALGGHGHSALAGCLEVPLPLLAPILPVLLERESAPVDRTVDVVLRILGTLVVHPVTPPRHDFQGRESPRPDDRARDLILAFYAKVDNYDYGFFWTFHQDGTLELEVQLTGQMGTKAVAATDRGNHYGTLVSPGVVAPNHQHFFNFQLDLDVDGPANRVVEMNVVGEPAKPGLAAGLAMHETVFRTEQQGIRSLNLASHRMWKVESSTRKNSLG